MRIAFVSWEFPPDFGGGIGTYVAAMSRILARRGHSVRVVTIGSHRYPSREYTDGLEIIRLPLHIGTGPEPIGSLRSWQARSDAVAELLLRMKDLDLIEFADYRGEGVTYLATTSPGERPVCVVKLHTALNVLNKYNRSRVRYPVLESFEESALLAADRLVSPSSALIREARELCPRLPEVDLLPYPADPTFLDYPVPAWASGEGILYVGRLEERKGVETLIQAIPRVLAACPGATLHMCGGDTRVSEDVPSMQARLVSMLPREYRERVIFHGPMPREELIARYLSARVCVFPSLFENFPNTCLEAMSLGRPVVGTDNSGMAEMIGDGVSGRITRSGDVDHLATTLIELYNSDDAVRQAMGAAARQRMRDVYHPDRIAEAFEKLYEGYITAAAASRPESVRAFAAVPSIDTSDPPKVAVVIPCYNHGRYIRETLESVRGQTWPRIETVIVDDGSTDEETIRTLDELRREGYRVIRQENQGLAAARNTGVRATNCPFYLPLDADDRIAPDCVEKLIKPLLEDATLGYCYSHVEFFGAAQGVWQCPPYEPRRLLVENLSVATAVVRRSAFELVGGYSRDMVYGFEDWDFWIALLSVGYHGRCVPEPLFYYRKHPRGVSMLDNTQKHRAEMIAQMVRHHRSLFASMLEVSMTDKDSLFFHAHMQAAQLRETLAAGAGGAGVTSDPLYQELMAQAQLDHIENSRTWRMVQRIKQNGLYRWTARLRFGPDWDLQPPGETPIQRLERIRNSRFYRLIQAVKRTPIYRLYARRKYGPDFGAPAAGS